MPLPNYNATDPCFCLGKCTPNTSTSGTPPCKTGDCFELGTVVVSCENSVGPCGTGTTPFNCFQYPCENPTFKITNKDEIKGLVVDTIDKDGITYTTDGTLEPYDKVEVNFKASCPASEDCDHKSDYGSVVIYIKDLCLGVDCPEDHYCDKCNGECVALEPEISVGGDKLLKNEIRLK